MLALEISFSICYAHHVYLAISFQPSEDSRSHALPGNGRSGGQNVENRDFDPNKLEAPPTEQFNFSPTSASISEN
jgi:hypothetical protein